MINAGMNINYLVHNSFWVPGHFHLTVGTATALTIMAGSYWVLPQLTGKPLGLKKLAAVQPFIWFIGMTFMSNAMHRGGLLGIPRRVSEPQYDAFEYEAAFGSVAELDFQVALGGTLLFISLLLFLLVIAKTWLNGRVENPVDDELPEPLSGSENAPRILSNFKLWIGIAVLLVILAYAVPIGYIAIDGMYEGSEPIPVFIEVLLR
jgi:cytochrome c oxidase subunit 1